MGNTLRPQFERVEPQRAPEVFVILQELIKPVPVPKNRLPKIEIKPYVSAEHVEDTPETATGVVK